MTEIFEPEAIAGKGQMLLRVGHLFGQIYCFKMKSTVHGNQTISFKDLNVLLPVCEEWSYTEIGHSQKAK